MDGTIDIKFLITIGGIIFSVAGAAAVGKMQIKAILESLLDIERRLRVIDKRIDDLESHQGVIKNQVNVLKNILSPDNLAMQHRETAEIKTHIRELQRDVDRQYHMHNGAHPNVK
tara:strand:+ start:549 stop:893 length:345 start_codon:yes stop_codon:yes gene_type:complete